MPIEPAPSPTVGPAKPRLWSVLGPGLITGASDDDPSGIATYSQAGAQFGFGLSWTMLATWPLMVAIQEVSARIGRTTGRGLAGNLRRHYPDALLQGIVALLLLANIANIGADLGAMADALGLLVGGPHLLWVGLFGLGSVWAQVFVRYSRYTRTLKWASLSLFAYVAALAVVDVPWGRVAVQLVSPHLSLDEGFFTTLVAILGTTISPYLFFWQSSQEAEDQRVAPEREPLLDAPQQAPRAMARIRTDTMVGMGFSNAIALAIILTTGATLNPAGVTTVATAAQAAQALRPVAGPLAEAVFAAGILGTGLLAVPVLAGSAAYAVGEARKWPVGLGRRPMEAKAFYVTIALATLLGVVLNFTPIDPIRALYWSAVVNGAVAVPVMVMVMLMASRRRIMGPFAIGGWLKLTGWAATLVMAACVGGMVAGWVV
ncbi:MAG: NRAMP family divalent metal transporter [Actinomycetota bacterium]